MGVVTCKKDLTTGRVTRPQKNQSGGGTAHEEMATHLEPYPCRPTLPSRSRPVFILRPIERARRRPAVGGAKPLARSSWFVVWSMLPSHPSRPKLRVTYFTLFYFLQSSSCGFFVELASAHLPPKVGMPSSGISRTGAPRFDD